MSTGKCLVIGKSVKSSDIEKGKKRESKRINKKNVGGSGPDDDYDPEEKVKKKEARETRSATK